MRRLTVLRILAVAAVVLLALIVVLVVRRHSSAREGPISSRTVGGTWRTGQGEIDGKPIFTRFNIGLKPLIGRPEFPHQVGIVVVLNHPTADGLPAGPELKELDQIEEEIARRFLTGNESVFAGTITTNGTREFVLYTSNPGAASAKAVSLMGDIGHHQIQYAIHYDPKWENYRRKLSGGGA